jgi:hypothetical protein
MTAARVRVHARLLATKQEAQAACCCQNSACSIHLGCVSIAVELSVFRFPSLVPEIKDFLSISAQNFWLCIWIEDLRHFSSIYRMRETFQGNGYHDKVKHSASQKEF